MSDTSETVIPVDEQPSENGPVPTPHAPLDPPPTVEGDAPAAPASGVLPTPPSDGATKTRAKASPLEADLRRVLDAYVQGQLTLADNTLPTPHTLASEIAKLRGDGKQVSSGAVSAALIRWEEIGFAKLGQKPMVFLDYTDDGRNQGLNAMKLTHRANKAVARKAAKEPATTVPQNESPVPSAAPEAPATNEADVSVVTENVEVVEAPAAVDQNPADWEAGYAPPQAAQHDPAPTPF